MSIRMSGPLWRGWEAFREPQELEWRTLRDDVSVYQECHIKGRVLAILEKRPPYCDRGHWSVKCELPGIDGQDSFPRYYMRYRVARSETEEWLKWRLWSITRARSEFPKGWEPDR